MAVKLEQSKTVGALSLTPLIDVVFLLLIFFLVATKFEEEEREMKINLPQASEAKPLSAKPRELFINIDEKGNFVVDTRVLNAEGLNRVLKQATRDNPQGRPVIIRADKNVVFQHVATAMNLCNLHRLHDYKVAIDKQ